MKVQIRKNILMFTQDLQFAEMLTNILRHEFPCECNIISNENRFYEALMNDRIDLIFILSSHLLGEISISNLARKYPTFLFSKGAMKNIQILGIKAYFQRPLNPIDFLEHIRKYLVD